MSDYEVLQTKIDMLYKIVEQQQNMIDLTSKRIDILNDGLTKMINIMINEMSK